jgi:cytochrome c
MKRTIKLILSLFVVSFLLYCSPKVLPPTSSDLSQIKQVNPDVDTSSVARGYTIFARSCHKCHGLKNPANYTIEKWDKVLPVMAKKAKLNEDETGLVKIYVAAFCKKI